MFRDWRSGMLRAPENGAGTGGTPDGSGSGNGSQSAAGETPGDQQSPAPTFDAWYGGLDAAHKSFLDSHVQGLKTSLETERTQRKDFERQVKEFAGKFVKGSYDQKQAEGLAEQIALLERQAACAENAIRPEVGGAAT